jgi:hypothetical protein
MRPNLEAFVDELCQQFADAVVLVDEIFERFLQRLLHDLCLLEAVWKKQHGKNKRAEEQEA